MKDSINGAIKILDEAVPDPSQGLPDPIFYYISRTTPLINVDLLVCDPHHGALLSWRDDPYDGVGWHVPGGIIRYRETIEQRINQVAFHELGTTVSYQPGPVSVNEIIAGPEKRERAHFISMLYLCRVGSDYEIDNGSRTMDEPGYLAWHRFSPKNLLSWHEIYRKYIDDAIRLVK